MTRVLKKLNVQEVVNFILNCSPETNVYIGSDSERFRLNSQWHADYMIAVVVHINGRHGCKVFGQVVREPDYDQRKDRPAIRLMNEVVKVADVFAEIRTAMTAEVDRRNLMLLEQFDTGAITEKEYNQQTEMLLQKLDKEMQIHLDINPSKAHGSSCVLQEAIGYIRGTCNVVPLIKPNAFAASFAADRGIGLLENQG
jgi:uncharacterized protein